MSGMDLNLSDPSEISIFSVQTPIITIGGARLKICRDGKFVEIENRETPPPFSQVPRHMI